MSGWHQQVMYGFDTETTGVDVFNDRIVQASIVKVPLEGDPESRTWLVNPGIEIPEGAQKVHGITNERVQAEGSDPMTSVHEIASMVAGILKAGCPLVVFNAAYDLSLLDAECARWDLPTLSDRLEPDQWQSVVDPAVLCRGAATRDRKQKGKQFTLTYCCGVYKVPFEEKHDASNDAAAAVALAGAFCEVEDHIASYGPKALHTLQKTWRRARQLNLKNYFDEQGIEYDDVDPGWPLHTSLAVVTEEAS